MKNIAADIKNNLNTLIIENLHKYIILQFISFIKECSNVQIEKKILNTIYLTNTQSPLILKIIFENFLHDQNW